MVWSCRMNVTWDVYRVIIMNNEFTFQGAIYICIPSHNTMTYLLLSHCL